MIVPPAVEFKIGRSRIVIYSGDHYWTKDQPKRMRKKWQLRTFTLKTKTLHQGRHHGDTILPGL
jgi:hypothetical protein